MKCAIIGCGRISTNHVTAIERNGFDLVAVCDVLPERMESLLAKHGLEGDRSICRYTDYRQMLAEHPEIELAAVATESGEHAGIALDLIDRGVNVIVEKPLAMSMADADEIVRRADAAGVKVCACHQNRFNVAVQETRRALEGGRFGRLSNGAVNIRWNRNRAYYEQAPWRGTWAQDGGCLMNQCIHGIDLLRWMMGGDVVEVYGATGQRQHGYLEAEDAGVAVLKFADGAVATVEGTVNVYPRNLEETLCLIGETGTVRIGGTSTNNIDVWDFADEREGDEANRGLEEATSNVYGNGHTAVYADMAEAIRDDRPPYIDARAGRDALEVVLAIYKSQRTGQPVRLPLGDFASTDMAGEFGEGSL
ncbi:Gfo/Idh/MocA family oxidoreductase [Coriobacteriaceae bacterium]|nr:Gfo/Idh/MocA family oxidoreductase [Coriobacteriaceae bacterium]